jgi:pimeloyl-ACP methyl ester carboxylesterase
LNVYFISGMGADHRAFSFLTLPKGFHAVHINWIPPHDKETLRAYALRLADQIDRSKPFVLIGLSMGGMMAVEIAKQFPPVCTILISSIPIAAHLPRYYKTAVKINATKLLPPALIKAAVRFKYALIRRPSPTRQLIYSMLEEGNDQFLKWAMVAVPQWDNDKVPYPFFQIHGTSDKVLPIRLTRPTHIIPNAGHTLIMSHPAIINTMLREILSIPVSSSPV